MNNTNWSLSLEQIDNMKHAVGFKHSKVRRGKYFAYRNYYTTSGNDASWDDLVNQGIATNRPLYNGQGLIYFLSDRGMAVLSKILGLTISEEG